MPHYIAPWGFDRLIWTLWWLSWRQSIPDNSINWSDGIKYVEHSCWWKLLGGIRTEVKFVVAWLSTTKSGSASISNRLVRVLFRRGLSWPQCLLGPPPPPHPTPAPLSFTRLCLQAVVSPDSQNISWANSIKREFAKSFQWCLQEWWKYKGRQCWQSWSQVLNVSFVISRWILSERLAQLLQQDENEIIWNS